MYQNLEASWHIVCFLDEPELNNCPICGKSTDLTLEENLYLGFPIHIIRARCKECGTKGKPYLFRSTIKDNVLMCNLSDSIKSAIRSWNNGEYITTSETS